MRFLAALSLCLLVPSSVVANPIWLVVAPCDGGLDECAFSPPEPLPTRAACFWYGRKKQLERGLPMNGFNCVEVK